MRFTIRGMIVAVGVVAILIPFPLTALLLAIGTLVIWFGLPALTVLACDLLGGRRAAIVASFLIAAWGTLATVGSPLRADNLVHAAARVLTTLNLAGPLYLAIQLRRRASILAGEAIWGWVGLMWATWLIHANAHQSSGMLIPRLELMAQGARLTLALILLLALYGRRPDRPDSARAHYGGWCLAGCDVIGWGYDGRNYL